MSHDPEDRGDHRDAPEGWSELGASYRAAPAGPSSFESVDGGAVRERADAFARTIRYRNAREVAAAGIVIVAGAFIAARATTVLSLLGGVAMVGGAIFVAVFMLARAGNLRAPEPAVPTSEVLAYERAQLERQAHLLERVWIWYLAPLLPSIVLLYADSLQRALRAPDSARGPGVAVLAALFAATIGVLALIGWINRRAARGLRDRMTRLPPAE